MSEIWAVLEYNEDILSEQNAELLAELAEVAQRQQDSPALCAILLAIPDTPSLNTTLLAKLGVQHVYLIQHPQLAHYTTANYVSILADLLQQRNPKLVATSATANGRDWMPRLAARLHLPFAANCLGLDLHDDALFALHSIYEGRAYVQTRTALHERTALVTLVPGGRGAPTNMQGFPSHELTVTSISPDIPSCPEQERIRRIALQAPSAEEVELDTAEKIVAGGRGVGREGFAYIADFARLLGAAVGATRVATDRGWIEHTRQIGSTGKSVHPKLYIACGISGATQHISGMRDVQTVVAINPDRNAPIFTLAELGLLGDANAIIPLAGKMIEQASHR